MTIYGKFAVIRVLKKLLSQESSLCSLCLCLLCTLFYPWLFGNPSWTLRKRFGPSPHPSPSMGRVLVTLFVSFCLRCNFFSSLRGGREGAASFGSSALPLNHIAKIRRIWHTTMDFRNVNCTTLHNLNFVPERFWYSTKNDYICIVKQTQ